MIVLRLLSWTLDLIEFFVSPLGLSTAIVAIAYETIVMNPQLDVLSVDLMMAVCLVQLYQVLDEYFAE